MKNMSTKTTQAPSWRLPSLPAHTVDELEEDKLWEKANDIFPDLDLSDLLAHPEKGPGLYIFYHQTWGLVPCSLLHNPEAAVTTLEDLFHNTFDNLTNQICCK